MRLDDYVNNQSQYWEQLDIAFDARKSVLNNLTDGRGLDPINTYDELITAINTATNRATFNMLTAQLKMIDKRSASLRKTLRRLNPELDVALYITRGLVPITQEARVVARSKRKFQ